MRYFSVVLLLFVAACAAAQESRYLTVRVTSPGGVGWSYVPVELQGYSALTTLPLVRLSAQTDGLGFAHIPLDAITTARFHVSLRGFANVCSTAEFSRDTVTRTGVIAEPKRCNAPITHTFHAHPGELTIFAEGNAAF